MMKKLLIGFGALVVLVVAAAFIIPAFVPVDVYKAQIEERVRAATGRDFVIRGPVSLAILPSLAVRADDAALGNVPGAAAAQMIAIRRLDVEVALMPLLSGRIEVTRLVLTEPQIALEIDRNGRPNWAMGPAGAPPAAPPAPQAGQAPAPQAAPAAPGDPLAGVPDVALGDVRIVNGRFDFRDARSNQRLELTAVNLTLSLPGLDQPVGITGDATWNGEKVTVELRTPAPRGLAAGRAGPVAVKIDAAPLRLDVAMNADPANPLRSTGDVTLAVPVPSRLAAWLAPVATIDQASLRDLGAANLRLRISANNELAVTGDVQFRNEKLELNLEGVSLAAIVAQRATPVRGRLGGVAGAQAQLDGTFTPAPAPSFAGTFNLAAPSLARLAALVGRGDALAALPGRDVTAIALQGRLGAAMELNVTGRATLNGEALTLAIESGPLAQVALARVPLTMRVQGQPLTLAFNGQLERSERGAPPPAVGTLELAVPSVRRLAAWAGQPLPDSTAPGQLNALSFQGRVSLAPTRVTMTDARFALDQIRSTGNLEADLSGRRPKISGRLAVDRLDLNPYVGGARNGTRPAAAAAPAGGSANQAAPRTAGGDEAAIDASALRAFDMDLSLNLAGLAMQAIELGRTALRIQLDEGLLTANVAEMALYNGQLRGTTRLDARQAALGVHSQMTMAGVRALPLLRATANFEKFEGTINAEWNLQGAGRSQQAIIRALGGNGRFRVTDGAIVGVNLAALVRNVGALGLSSGARETQRTDFSELSGSFTMQNGIANTQDLSMASPLIRLQQGRGSVNIPAKTVDMRLDVRLVATLQGQGGRDARGVTVPVQVTGPFDNLSYRPDFTGVNPQDLQEVIRNPGEALRGVLGGQGGQQQNGQQPQGGIGGAIQGIIPGQRQPPPAQGGQQQQQQQQQQGPIPGLRIPGLGR